MPEPTQLPDSYFAAPNEFEKFAEARRLSANGLLWQVPGLSLTAQSFLIGAAIAESAGTQIRFAVAIFAIVIALATMQLLMRHRFREQLFSHALDESRIRRGAASLDFPDSFEEIAKRRSVHPEQRSYHEWERHPMLRVALWPAWKTWIALFSGFILLDVAVAIDAAV